MATNQIQELDHDPIAHLDEDAHTALSQHLSLSGCYSIIGPVQLCYSQVGSGFQVCLQLAGVQVSCVTIDANNPCANLDGNVLLAKASIQVCVQGSCLTYNAQACYRATPFSSWNCVSSSGNIICF